MRIIAGEARGRIIEAPAGSGTRPTLDRVRENLFNMLQGEVENSHVLDLFAGSGALSLEALSRGAADAVLCDVSRQACAVQKRNIEKLRYADRTVQYCLDWKAAVSLLKKERRQYDLVFLDPPYAADYVTALLSSLIPLIHEQSLVILEHESGKDAAVPEGFRIIKSRSWGYCAVSIFRPIRTEGGKYG